MTGKTKITLFFLSTAAFLILSYFVVLYAYGYKFDFGQIKWRETGSVLIKANADGALVSINDRLAGKIALISNTFTRKNLFPGSYDVRLTKEGLPSITKLIEVKSGEVVQLIHLHLASEEEILKTISDTNSLDQLQEDEKNYFISNKDGLLYKKSKEDEIEQISSDPVYIKNYDLRVLENGIYLVSWDIRAPGIFVLDNDGWKNIYDQTATQISLSKDQKKLAIVGTNEINVLWLKDESESPYFEKGHKELVARISQKITRIIWFKTNWHLIYITESGEAHFLEIDGTGGRNDILSLAPLGRLAGFL